MKQVIMRKTRLRWRTKPHCAPGRRGLVSAPAEATIRKWTRGGFAMVSATRPFQLHVGHDAIDDLRARLARTRLPDQAPGAPWAFGTDVAYLRELVEHWRTR